MPLKARNQALAAGGVAVLGLAAACCIVRVHQHARAQVALAGVDAPVHLRGARLQRLDAEEAAVLGQPQYIDHGVPQPQLRDEETDIADAAETDMRENRRTAQKAQGEISALDKFLSSLNEKFIDYEKGNPYFDPSVTFTLENQDDDDEDSDASAVDEGSKKGGSSLASSDVDTDSSSVDQDEKGVKEKKPGEPDVVVKFDKYLGEKWDKFYRGHWGKNAARQQRAAHRSSLSKRVRSDMADSDFVE